MTGLFLLLFLAAPVILIFGITYLVERIMKTNFNPLFSFLVSFAVAYVLVSAVLFILECEQPPSELFGLPWLATIEILSAPTGMVADHLFRAKIIGVYTRDGLKVLAGLIQWEIILFFVQRWWLRKTVKKT